MCKWVVDDGLVVGYFCSVGMGALRLPGIPPAVGTLQPGRTPVFSLDLKPRRPRVFKVARAVSWLMNRQPTAPSRLAASLTSSGFDCVSFKIGVEFQN